MSVAGWSLADLRTAYLTEPDHVPPTVAAIPPASEAAGGVGVVGVLGVSGGVGTTTVALALAEALRVKRLVELALPHASGLAAAAIDELGDRDGWRIGVRGELELARRLSTASMAEVQDGDVVDLGSWSGQAPGLLVDRLVVVAACCVASVRRLDACLQSLAHLGGVVPVITRAPRRLPRELLGAAGQALRRALTCGEVRVMPECRGLSLTGLTPDRLPRSLQQSAAGLVSLVKDTP